MQIDGIPMRADGRAYSGLASSDVGGFIGSNKPEVRSHVKLIQGTFKRLLPLLSREERAFLWWFMALSTALSILDIVALGLLAVSLSSMVQSNPVDLPFIGAVDKTGYIWIFLAVCVLIIVKSVCNVALQWVATRRFAGYELGLGDRLFDAYIKAPWVDRISKSTSQLVRLADVGISTTTSGFLLPVMTIPSLVATFIAVFAVVIVAQPVTAMITLIYLGLIGLILYRWVSRRAIQAGRVNRDYSIRAASLMTDMVNAMKEITLRNKTAEVARNVHDRRVMATKARSNLYFLGAVPKFILDGALIGGFVLVGAAAYITGGLTAAITSISLFGVAGFRILPNLVSFQGLTTNAQANAPYVEMVIEDIEASRGYLERAERIGNTPLDSDPKLLELKDVSFTYPSSDIPAISGVTLRVPMGSTLGLVGQSGAGKSTLVDILLGLMVPSAGSIEVDGRPIEEVLSGWRSRVGYVPQQVALFNGSVAQNVALSWDSPIEYDKVETALKRAQLWDAVSARPGGMDSSIGDAGISLSGGQRQRLGIARALYGEPLVLVLDEATSALDTKTEADVADAIRSLRGETTVVSVAHRLSTVKDNDQLCFLADGKIVAQGTFEELVRDVPAFAEQAALAGLA